MESAHISASETQHSSTGLEHWPDRAHAPSGRHHATSENETDMLRGNRRTLCWTLIKLLAGANVMMGPGCGCSIMVGTVLMEASRTSRPRPDVQEYHSNVDVEQSAAIMFGPANLILHCEPTFARVASRSRLQPTYRYDSCGGNVSASCNVLFLRGARFRRRHARKEVTARVSRHCITAAHCGVTSFLL